MAASPKPSAGLAFRLLASESRAEFESLESQFEQELQPKGVVERMLVRELVRITWRFSDYGPKCASTWFDEAHLQRRI
jgi:hypothetical protein